MYTDLSTFVVFVICDRIYKVVLIWSCLCHSDERNMSLTENDMIFINTIKIFLSWIITSANGCKPKVMNFLIRTPAGLIISQVLWHLRNFVLEI